MPVCHAPAVRAGSQDNGNPHPVRIKQMVKVLLANPFPALLPIKCRYVYFAVARNLRSPERSEPVHHRLLPLAEQLRLSFALNEAAVVEFPQNPLTI